MYMKHKKSHHKSHHSSHHKGRGFVEGHDEGVGKGNFANLPQHVVQKEYPKAHMMRGGMLDDTITGIDSVQDRADGTTVRHLSNQK